MTLDSEILAMALACGNGFAFGVFQLVIKNSLPPSLKPGVFVVLSVATSLGCYYGLVMDSLILKLLIAATSSAYAVTGGIDFYKKDMKEGVAI